MVIAHMLESTILYVLIKKISIKHLHILQSFHLFNVVMLCVYAETQHTHTCLSKRYKTNRNLSVIYVPVSGSGATPGKVLDRVIVYIFVFLHTHVREYLLMEFETVEFIWYGLS